ncbi:hypothetical protein TWF102_003560 [Orbilia oligospora]|uniref:Uncharacterized protein n=1 Tax=Orbilia oligospora TaxID=2813651 RepID=A0A7C8IZ19_ORBOL|nr:hypothetical protein TWF102_003560 [Orbilia oligospora]
MQYVTGEHLQDDACSVSTRWTIGSKDDKILGPGHAIMPNERAFCSSAKLSESNSMLTSSVR